MATSGSINTPYANFSRFYLRWQVSRQDIANNRTKVNWQVGLTVTSNAWWGLNAVRVNSVHIDGGGSLGSGTWSNISGNRDHQLLSGSKWVSHNSDGTKSFGANVSGWLWDEGTKTASGSWALPTIPRNSQVSTNKTSYTLGEAIGINTNRKSSSFTHRIRIRRNNSSGTLIKEINSVGASTTWTPSPAEITQMQNMIPNSNSLTLYIESYNNQVKQASSVTRTLTLTDANPTFENFTFKDIDATTVGITGNDQILVKGKSTLEVTVPAADKMTANKGASEKHYTFSYDGTTKQETYDDSNDVDTTFTPIVSTGTRTIIVRAFDSRNNSTTVSKDVTVYDYTEPVINTSVERQNNFETDTTIKISGRYDILKIGEDNKNELTEDSLEYRYQEDGEDWGSWTPVAFTVDDEEGTFDTDDFVLALDNQKKFNFEFRIADKFGQVITTNFVDVGTPIMFIGQNGGDTAIGINKMPENGALDVAGDIYSNGEKLVTGTTATLVSPDWAAIPGGGSRNIGTVASPASASVAFASHAQAYSGWPNITYSCMKSGSNFVIYARNVSSNTTTPSGSVVVLMV